MPSAFTKYMVCIVWNIIKWRNGHKRWVVGGFCGYGGSVLVIGEWAVGYWIVGVISFQKIHGLIGWQWLVLQWFKRLKS